MIVVIRMVKPHIVKKWRQSGHRPLQELLLTRDLEHLGLADLAEPVPATRGRLAAADEARQPVEAAPGEREADDRDAQSDDDPR